MLLCNRDGFDRVLLQFCLRPSNQKCRNNLEIDSSENPPVVLNQNTKKVECMNTVEGAPVRFKKLPLTKYLLQKSCFEKREVVLLILLLIKCHLLSQQ